MSGLYKEAFPTEFRAQICLDHTKYDFGKLQTAIEDGVRLAREAGLHIHKTGYAEDYLRFRAEEQLWKALFPGTAFPRDEPQKYTPWQIASVFPLNHNPDLDEPFPGPGRRAIRSRLSRRKRIQNRNVELAWVELELLDTGKMLEKDLSLFAKQLLVKERRDGFVAQREDSIEENRSRDVKNEDEERKFEVTAGQLAKLYIQTVLVGKESTPKENEKGEGEGEKEEGEREEAGKKLKQAPDFWMEKGSEEAEANAEKMKTKAEEYKRLSRNAELYEANKENPAAHGFKSMGGA